jgi:hypothetical protein
LDLLGLVWRKWLSLIFWSKAVNKPNGLARFMVKQQFAAQAIHNISSNSIEWLAIFYPFQLLRFLSSWISSPTVTPMPTLQPCTRDLSWSQCHEPFFPMSYWCSCQMCTRVLNPGSQVYCLWVRLRTVKSNIWEQGWEPSWWVTARFCPLHLGYRYLTLDRTREY